MFLRHFPLCVQKPYVPTMCECSALVNNNPNLLT